MIFSKILKDLGKTDFPWDTGCTNETNKKFLT